MRSGTLIKQPSGYRAFIPAALPPDPPVLLDAELSLLLSRADRALGRLDGVTSTLPNPTLFVAMYVRQEAVLSSQIEGTQSTLEDVLEFEVGQRGDQPKDIEEVVNYIRAMQEGLRALDAPGSEGGLPLSLRLLRRIHGILLNGVRGQNRMPGEFRTSQNWIGPEGSTLNTASFVPPPPAQMETALGDFERFLHDTTSYPDLIHCGLAHAQFETIHPFLDGNGRVGRLLVTFLLCERRIIEQPLLYISHYLKLHRLEYYDRLTAVRERGDWEGWLKFFLRGVYEVSQAATTTARAILQLRESHRQALNRATSVNGHLAFSLLDYLFQQPIVNVNLVARHLDCAYATANKLIGEMEEIGFVREVTGNKRNRKYHYEPYLNLFESYHRAETEEDARVEVTQADEANPAIVSAAFTPPTSET